MAADFFIHQPIYQVSSEKMTYFSSVYFIVQELQSALQKMSSVIISCCHRCWNWAAMEKKKHCWLWERLLFQALTKTISASLLMSPWTQTLATSMCLTATAILGFLHSQQRANICPTGEQVHTLPLKHCCYCVHGPKGDLTVIFSRKHKGEHKTQCAICVIQNGVILDMWIYIYIYKYVKLFLKLGGLSGPQYIWFCNCL